MRNQMHWPRLWRLPVYVACLISALLGGCSSGGDTQAVVDGTLALTATNAAAVGGLAFRFVDGAILGFAGQEATVTLGADGTTFTLATNHGTVVSGMLTFGSCIFTETSPTVATDRALFMQTYATCQVSGASRNDINFGGSGNGTLLLRLGRDSGTIINSEAVSVVYHVDASGRITINANTTPIGVTG